MKEIYIIRHTKVNLPIEVCYGQSDVGLDSNYMEEFKNVRNKIPADEELVYYSSPLSRCTMLADFLSGSNFKTDDRLKEIDLGDDELKSWPYIQENLFLNFQGNFVNNRCPNGESYMDLHKRTSEFYEEIVNSDHNKIAIVTHMNVIRAMVSQVLEMPHKNFYRLKLNYGCVSKVNINNNIIHLNYFGA